MHPVCALVFAGLCLSRHDLEITSTFSMIVMKDHGFSQEAVRRRGVEIDAMESDSIEVVDGLFMDRVCSNGWCLNYWRDCQETVCKFGVTDAFREAAPGREAVLAMSFEVHARTRSLLRGFMNTLWVVLSDESRSPMAYVPLSRLSGGHKRLFYCSPVVWYEGCSRPTRPLMKRPDRV
jgi:hypothetical protein